KAVRGEDDARRGHRLEIHVEERQGIQDAVAASLEADASAEIPIPGARVQVVEVGQDAALRSPRRPRGVEEATLGLESWGGGPGDRAGLREPRGHGPGVHDGQGLRTLAADRLEVGDPRKAWSGAVSAVATKVS